MIGEELELPSPDAEHATVGQRLLVEDPLELLEVQLVGVLMGAVAVELREMGKERTTLGRLAVVTTVNEARVRLGSQVAELSPGSARHR